jgi:2-iminoacetate synthase
MKYIDESRIKELLKTGEKKDSSVLDSILQKSRHLKRLSLEETAVLLAAKDPSCVKKILETASFVKDKIYGRRIVLFTPLYISNICANACLYCAFKSDNKLLNRRSLTIEEVKEEVRFLLERGHKRILMVAGESAPAGRNPIDYYVDAVSAVYSVNVGQNKIKRVNVNCAPLSIEEFKRLKKAGIGTYQLFQETYHEDTYKFVHPKGPKKDPDNRMDAIDRAFLAGIDDVGIGVLYGLYDYKFETLAMLMHVEHLENKFKVGPHTISVPRIEPALGSPFSCKIPYKVSDDEFKKLVAVIRLSVPYTGIILSTREKAKMRDELFSYGVSQISAESSTSPGGHSKEKSLQDAGGQFNLSDHRSLDEIMKSLIDKEFIPSFCAACYRKERTGEAFMNLAKPGTIKGKCSINALITLKEYLDDFASEDVKKTGYKFIQKITSELDETSQKQLSEFIKAIDSGARDKYI